MLTGKKAQQSPDKGKAKASTGHDAARRSATASALTHGKDAKLAQRVLEAAQRQPDPSKVLEPKSIGRKAVFRPILSSPFVVDWPSINAADLTAVLHTLLSFLQLAPLQNRLARINTEVPRSSAAKTKEKNQRRRARLLLATLHRHGVTPVLTQSMSNETQGKQKDVSIDRNDTPVVLCGLNSITRLLEAHISRQAHPSDEGEGDDENQDLPLHAPSIIVVCQADISPPTLVAHLPLLVATYNAMCKCSVSLIRLPSGSEALLSDAVQLRRCSVLSIDFAALQRCDDAIIADGLKELQKTLADAHVQPTQMPWLENAVQSMSRLQRPTAPPASTDLLPPRIKHMRSSAPIDMNAVKAAKRTKRQQSKQKHRDRVKRLKSTGA